MAMRLFAFLGGQGAYGIARLSFEPNADRNRGKGESGQGIQALRLADAPGEEGSPFAPTRSDCRQCDPTALAVVSRSLGLVDGVSCRVSQHRSTDRPNEI
jgi:hypothetical protein